MLRCPGDQVLSAFIDGALPAAQIMPLEAHLLECDDCRGLVAALARTLRSASRSGAAVPEEEPLLAAGALVGRYQIVRALAAGGMGIVYEARDPDLGRRIALKLLRGGGSPEAQRALVLREAQALVLREAQALARLSHPNVVAVHDVAFLGERICVAMELVEGGTLREWLRSAKRQPREVLAILLQAGRGLAAAHAAGLVHRDFKPDNVLVGLDGRARVTDFGLARLGAPEPAAAEALIGSPAYMAPEQLGGGEAGPASDLFSFSATAWEALAGGRPFAGATVEELRASVGRQEVRGAPPKRLRAALLRGLAADPRERPASMEALLAALERAALWPRRALALAAAALAVAAAALLLRPQSPTWRPEVVPLLPVGDDEAISFPAFSPDGRSLAYVSDRDGWDRLFLAPASGGAPRPLTPPGLSACNPRWSNDGSAILLLDTQEQLYRVPLDGGAPLLLMRGPRAFAECGVRLVLSLRGAPGCADCPRLVERTAAGDRLILQQPSRAVINDVRCDAQGRTLVYSQSGPEHTWAESAALWTVPLAGGDPQRLTDGLSFDFNPTFHPDGRSVIFSRWQKGRARLWEMPARGGSARQLTFAESEDEDKGADVSPDGRALVYVNERTIWELEAYSLSGGGRVKLSQLEDVGRIAATADAVIGESHQYFAATRRRTVKSWPLHGGAPRDLGEGYAPALTPDGAQVVFAQLAGNDASRVVAVPRSGGPPRTIAEVPGDVKEIGIGQDGILHLTVRGERGATLYRVPLSGGKPEAETPAWGARIPSPAGGFSLVFSKVESGYEARLLADRSGAPVYTFTFQKRMAWAPRGDALLYFNGSEVRRYTLATRADQPLFPVRNVDGIASSPDGRTIYVAEPRTRGVRRMITNFAERN